tara:strand:- start:13068 stop:14861 length:1794 start_codon:yes stop_codon:yes gene_type:complete
MENNRIVEVVTGGIHKRNTLMPYNNYLELESKNAFKKEMYRSYYMFDDTFSQHVATHKSVKGYNGLVYPDRLIIDLDKGDIDGENLQSYLKHVCNELFDFGIDSSHINVWFSGSGYHIELLNVFGFQPNKNLHVKVKSTLTEHFSFGDNIYDKTRIIRSKWSLNLKTNLYKVWIPLEDIWTISYDDVCNLAKSKKTYNEYVKTKPNFYATLNSEDVIIEPYLQTSIIASPSNSASLAPVRAGDTNSVVTCVQHIFNEGPSQGSRNKNMMRMVSSWKRAGIPFIVTLNGMIKWSQGELDTNEIERTVMNVYDNQYIYGCDDAILMEYCDPKCIHFKRKDYVLDIRDVDSLENTFVEYIQKDFTKRSINIADVFPGGPDYIFKPGELVVFSGDTGMGKTAFVQNLVAKSKKDTLFLSLEMNEILIWRRFAQIIKEQSADWVINQYKSNPDFTVKSLLDHLKIMVIAPEIEAVKKVVAQYEPNILVIDTTDEMQVDRYDGEIQKQNVIIDALKQIAQRNNTLIFAIHHLNKASASQGTVGLHSLKGSSNVVQKADKVIVLKGNRNEIYRTIMSEKSRDDGKLEFVTEFHPETMTFKRIEV